MECRTVLVDEAVKALRLAQRYGGKFAQDELEYAHALLDELEAEG